MVLQDGANPKSKRQKPIDLGKMTKQKLLIELSALAEQTGVDRAQRSFN